MCKTVDAMQVQSGQQPKAIMLITLTDNSLSEVLYTESVNRVVRYRTLITLSNS